MGILLCSPHNALNSNAQSLKRVLDRAVIAKSLMPEFKSGPIAPEARVMPPDRTANSMRSSCPFCFLLLLLYCNDSDRMLQCRIDNVFQCIVCCAGLRIAALENLKTTPVGFEPTRGDPIGLAGRRLNRSAKVSLVCSAMESMRLALPGYRVSRTWVEMLTTHCSRNCALSVAMETASVGHFFPTDFENVVQRT